jgi:hypothetical protein
MNPEFTAGQGEGVEGADEALSLFDPAAPTELPPEQLDVWLDRLVDGEVADPQRQALLSRLEQSPGGWRRCALAFLEAQAWREAMSPAAASAGDWGASLASPEAEGASDRGSPLAPALSPERRGRNAAASPPGASPGVVWHWRPLLGMVAAAASFALAFGLGLLVHKSWLGPNQASGDAAVTGHMGRLGGSLAPVAADNSSHSGQMKWGAVQFVVDGPEGSPRQVRLPAVDGPDPERWLSEQPPAIPDEIVQELRRRGHHVETQRQYLPVPLDDGRSAVFPVDQVDVRFRGGKGYQ